MDYINTKTGEYPVPEHVLRSRCPNVIFPVPFEPPEGYAVVEFGTMPEHNTLTHKVVEVAPELVDGKWLQRWDVVALTSQEIDDARRAMVPSAVTMRQARLALLGAGLLDDVEAAITALPSPQKEAAKIEWEYSQEVQRHNGFVSVLAPMLGMSPEQTDALFVQAAAL